jgi:hydroxymethylbilane synthase
VPEGARVGTASRRRRAQLLAARPDLEVRELRGNVDTRLRKLADGDLDGIVLASAGLRRLGREDEIAFALPAEAMTPASGQGSLVLQIRDEDDEALGAVEPITHGPSLRELTAERTVVTLLEATCDSPLGVRGQVDLGGGLMRLEAFVGLPDGSEWVRDAIEGDSTEPTLLGAELTRRLLGAGARELLDRAEGAAA